MPRELLLGEEKRPARSSAITARLHQVQLDVCPAGRRTEPYEIGRQSADWVNQDRPVQGIPRGQEGEQHDRYDRGTRDRHDPPGQEAGCRPRRSGPRRTARPESGGRMAQQEDAERARQEGHHQPNQPSIQRRPSVLASSSGRRGVEVVECFVETDHGQVVRDQNDRGGMNRVIRTSRTAGRGGEGHRAKA